MKIKNKIINAFLVTTLFGSSFVYAQDERGRAESRYLNPNNVVSSFAIEVSRNLSDELTRFEKEQVREFQYNINQKLISSGLEQNINFRTAQYELDEPVLNYLNNIVLSLNNYKSLNYELNGYADYRGNSEYNLDLSRRRVHSVVDVLKDLGVSEENIHIEYYGDEKSEQHEDPERYFYDRRVELKINIK